ncbi:hypothetical protein Tco_1081552 [Tanacetum coccineum]|uniref:Uncharacterized protein n=1 Tax=Tanacetum coccineum TaxID=301880 RepID=A0ABQ5HZZ1_9ASTR
MVKARKEGIDFEESLLVARLEVLKKASIGLKQALVHVIIMAQQQHAADVYPDELSPPNKRYDLMDANKKVDLEHVQCPSESKILMNIIKNHPLRSALAVQHCYLGFICTILASLKETDQKHSISFAG